jgi:hypothetical protein
LSWSRLSRSRSRSSGRGRRRRRRIGWSQSNFDDELPFLNGLFGSESISLVGLRVELDKTKALASPISIEDDVGALRVELFELLQEPFIFQ